MGAWNFVDRRLEKVLVGIGGKATRPTLCRARRGCQPGHRFGSRASVRSRRPWSPPRWEPREMATEIKVPTLGESVTSATVARWMKHEGEAVAADEPLVELETDKVTVEVNAPSAGVLTIDQRAGGQRGAGRRAARLCWKQAPTAAQACTAKARPRPSPPAPAHRPRRVPPRCRRPV